MMVNIYSYFSFLLRTKLPLQGEQAGRCYHEEDSAILCYLNRLKSEFLCLFSRCH